MISSSDDRKNAVLLYDAVEAVESRSKSYHWPLLHFHIYQDIQILESHRENLPEAQLPEKAVNRLYSDWNGLGQNFFNFSLPKRDLVVACLRRTVEERRSMNIQQSLRVLSSAKAIETVKMLNKSKQQKIESSKMKNSFTVFIVLIWSFHFFRV